MSTDLAQSDDSRPTILLVIDVYSTCKDFRQQFEQQGYRVRTATDEQSGIDYAPFVNPDLILIGLGLSQQESLRVGCRVRDYAAHGSDVLVVVLASKTDKRMSEGGEVAHGHHTYVTLPADFAQLQRYAARLLQQAQDEAASRLPDAVAQRPFVLVVDDAEDVRELLVFVLTRRGYQVLAARDGQEAVEIASGQRPELILMDLSMPVLDGYGAVQRMRDMTELCDVPIIAVSANRAAEHRAKALDIGFNEYLSKPIDFTQLESLLQQFLKAA